MGKLFNLQPASARGEKIRARRAALGLSLDALSKLTGISIATLSLYERLPTKGSVETLQKVSKALGLPIEELIQP